MKIVVSVIGGGLFITWTSSDLSFSGLKLILGINSNNIYLGLLSLIVMFMILGGISYLLIKEAEVKEI